jgi:hypothetical protein
MTKLNVEKWDSTKIVEKLDQLSVEREHYEANELLRSNQRLYTLLGEVLTLYYTANTSETLLRDTIKVVKARLTERGIRVQRNSVALTLFVRYMFNSDRQRSLNYSRALQAAAQAKIQPEDFARFVDDNGGIEECKRKVAISAEALEKRQAVQSAEVDAEIAIELFKDEPIATFNVELSDIGDDYKKGLMFIAAQVEDDGTVNALYLVPAYNAFVERWAKQKLAKKFADKKTAENKSALMAAEGKAIGAAAAAATLASVTETEELRQAA